MSAIAELCWYLSGSENAESISFWIPRYRENAEDSGNVNGAYGPRIFGAAEYAQIERVIGLIRDHPSTRRAVVQIFDRIDLASSTRFRDVPCTTTMQFLRREDKLHMVVTMRSNDAYLGLPHDLFAFTMLQEIIARELEVEVGEYHHMVGSLHIYDQDLPKVEQYLAEGWQSSENAIMPVMPLGSQKSHLDEVMIAETELRQGADYSSIHLPVEPYWADLVRLLAIFCARRNRDSEGASTIANEIADDSMRSLIKAELVHRQAQ